MVGRFITGMASGAIYGARRLVVEVCWSPGSRPMAGGALPSVMISRFILGMAGAAIADITLVVEIGRLPHLGGVAI